MPYSMYQASIPLLVHGLTSLGAFLEKGQADATARGYAPEVLLQSRLAPDMHPLIRQVQLASDMAKSCGRLTGGDIPSFPDTETSFEQLQERIANTAAYLNSITPAELDSGETRTVELKFPHGARQFPGVEFLGTFVMPNFYFHMTVSFAILRHNGVKIGKMDFLGAS